MLIIRRRSGEGITIGDNISIQILEISPSRVKLGILAPRDVPVQRSELEVSTEENQRASSSTPLDAAAAQRWLSSLVRN
jgi:carbon storage regulator